MTPVEEIRKAAALMRERAEAAKGSAAYGPWWTSPSDPLPQFTVFAGCGCITDEIAVVREKGESPKLSQHIASWHPQVALAVADWLDGVANEDHASDNGAQTGFDCCTQCHDDNGGPVGFPCSVVEYALAVARAYVGGES